MCRIYWHSLIRCNRGFSPRRISSISPSLVYVCKNACTNGIVTRSKDRSSTIGNDDSSRWRFIVRVYHGIIRGGRTFCGGSFDESFFTWMHKGNSRHSVGWRTFAQNCIWLDYLLHVGTDVPQEFLLPDKRRNHEPSRACSAVERISIGSYRWSLPMIRGGDISRICIRIGYWMTALKIDSFFLQGRLDWSTIFIWMLRLVPRYLTTFFYKWSVEMDT